MLEEWGPSDLQVTMEEEQVEQLLEVVAEEQPIYAPVHHMHRELQ